MIETADITDPAAAAVFAAPRQRKIVLALIDEERSLSELAALTGTPLNLLHHHMGRFLRLGLVEITRRQARAGAPIKFYRATARTFFVPAELAAASAGDPMAIRLRAALDRGLADSVKGRAYSHEDGGPRMRLVRDPDPRPTAAEFWLELRLDAGDAAALTEAFEALLKRFEQRSGPRGRRYIIHAALAVS